MSGETKSLHLLSLQVVPAATKRSGPCLSLSVPINVEFMSYFAYGSDINLYQNKVNQYIYERTVISRNSWENLINGPVLDVAKRILCGLFVGRF